MRHDPVVARRRRSHAVARAHEHRRAPLAERLSARRIAGLAAHHHDERAGDGEATAEVGRDPVHAARYPGDDVGAREGQPLGRRRHDDARARADDGLLVKRAERGEARRVQGARGRLVGVARAVGRGVGAGDEAVGRRREHVEAKRSRRRRLRPQEPGRRRRHHHGARGDRRVHVHLPFRSLSQREPVTRDAPAALRRDGQVADVGRRVVVDSRRAGHPRREARLDEQVRPAQRYLVSPGDGIGNRGRGSRRCVRARRQHREEPSW